jgi:hypothetical protein
VAASSSEEEQNNNPAAYNASIYLMVGVPYLSLAIMGFLIYRGVMKNAEFRRNQESEVREQGVSPEGQ